MKTLLSKTASKFHEHLYIEYNAERGRMSDRQVRKSRKSRRKSHLYLFVRTIHILHSKLNRTRLLRRKKWGERKGETGKLHGKWKGRQTSNRYFEMVGGNALTLETNSFCRSSVLLPLRFAVWAPVSLPECSPAWTRPPCSAPSTPPALSSMRIPPPRQTPPKPLPRRRPPRPLRSSLLRWRRCWRIARRR